MALDAPLMEKPIPPPPPKLATFVCLNLFALFRTLGVKKPSTFSLHNSFSRSRSSSMPSKSRLGYAATSAHTPTSATAWKPPLPLTPSSRFRRDRTRPLPSQPLKRKLPVSRIRPTPQTRPQISSVAVMYRPKNPFRQPTKIRIQSPLPADLHISRTNLAMSHRHPLRKTNSGRKRQHHKIRTHIRNHQDNKTAHHSSIHASSLAGSIHGSHSPEMRGGGGTPHAQTPPPLRARKRKGSPNASSPIVTRRCSALRSSRRKQPISHRPLILLGSKPRTTPPQFINQLRAGRRRLARQIGHMLPSLVANLFSKDIPCIFQLPVSLRHTSGCS